MLTFADVCDLLAGLHQTHVITVAMGVVGIVFLGTCRQVAQCFFLGVVFFYAGVC